MEDQVASKAVRWHWVIAVSCAWLNFFHRSLIRSTAVVYVELIKTFHITREQAAWPLSMVGIIAGFSALLGGMVAQYFSDFTVLAFATVVSAAGIGLCFTATSITEISLYYSIGQGIGCGLVLTLTGVILNNSFKNNKATASGINLSGPTMASFVFPFLVQYLAEEYGLRGAFLILSGIILNAFPAVLLQNRKRSSSSGTSSRANDANDTATQVERHIAASHCDHHIAASHCDLRIASGLQDISLNDEKDIEAHKTLIEEEDGTHHNKNIKIVSSKNPKKDALDYDKIKTPKKISAPSKLRDILYNFKGVFLSPSFYLVCISQAVHMLVHSTFATIILDYAEDQGIPPEDGIYLLFANSVGDLFGRLCFGWISDKNLIKRTNIMIVNYMATGLLLLFATSMNSFTLLAVMSALMAVCAGSTVTLFAVLYFDFLGPQLMPLAYGLSNCVSGNFHFLRPMIIGYSRDNSGVYDSLYLLLGISQLIIAFLWVSKCLGDKYIKNRNSKPSAKNCNSV